jgi:hypothetical protein
LYDWSWARKEITASSWLDGVATLENVQRLKGVYYRADYNDRILRPEPYAALRRRSNYVGVPSVYAVIDESQVLVHPYPTTTDNKNKVLFVVVSWIELPTNDTSLFDFMPTAFVDLLISRASGLFSVIHNNDLALAQAYNSQYETLAQRLRDRYRNVSAEGLNMYRGGR